MTEEPHPGTMAIVAHARKVRDTTASKIKNAIRAIEADIEMHQGIYPYSTHITQAEVCRRAGVSRMSLQKDQHRQTRDDLKIWIVDIERKMAAGAKVVRRAVTDSIEQHKVAYNEIAQQWHEAELAFLETEHRLAMAEKETKRMKRRIAELEDQVAAMTMREDSKIVPFDRGKHDRKGDPR